MQLPGYLQSAILDAMAVAIVVTDSAGRILWVNRAFTQLTGYFSSEAIGQNMRLLKSDEQSPEFYQQMWETVQSGQVWQGEIINRRKDGSRYIEEQTVTPVNDDNGAIAYFVVVKQEITHRKEDEKRLRRQMDELTVFHGITQAGAEAVSIEALLERAMRAVKEHLYPDVDFGVGLVDEKSQSFLAYVNLLGKIQTLRIPLDQGIPAQVLASGKSIYLRDVKLDSTYVAVNQSIRSEVCAPLKAGDHIIGVLNAESPKVDAFDENDEQLLVTLAGQLAVSIERMRLYQNALRTTEKQEIMYRVSQEISASLELENVYQSIHRAVKELMPCEDFLIALLDEDRQEIHGVYMIELDNRLPTARFPASQGLSGNVIATGRSIKYDDFLTEHPELHSIQFGKDHTRSGIFVPLKFKGKPIGALSAQSYQTYTYTAEDEHILDLLASQAAIAIENARLFTEIQELATHDSLTGVFNRRHFFIRANEEVERANRYHQPLSVILFDVDHFKRVNDTYGHPTGDQVLQSIARRCRTSLRDVDIIGRYGGEEFIILMPSTDISNAAIVAERLRRGVLQEKFDTGNGPLTISLGVAAYDEGCKDIDVLLAHADKALYSAKNSGRNRVKVFE
ncbi:MAG: diguanylate cyclase [Anaerolineales bacterium]|nr:diguanylate cyclase [Anaerolineales bacterium]